MSVCEHKVCSASAHTHTHTSANIISCHFLHIFFLLRSVLCFLCSARALICFCARKSVGKRSSFGFAEPRIWIVCCSFPACEFALSFIYTLLSMEFLWIFFVLAFCWQLCVVLAYIAFLQVADNYASPAMNFNSPKWKLTFTCYPINYASWACKRLYECVCVCKQNTNSVVVGEIIRQKTCSNVVCVYSTQLDIYSRI